MLNGWEILALFVVFFLLFGAKKLPGLAKGLGRGIKEFKDGLRTGADTYGHLRTPTDTLSKGPTTAKSSNV